jgi:hypothetical protein
MAMGKKRLLIAVFVALLVASTMLAGNAINLSKGNFVGWVSIPPTIFFFTPQNNTLYTANNILLAFSISIPKTTTNLVHGGMPWKISYKGQYSLDGKVLGQFSGLNSTTYLFDIVNENLTGLTNGIHEIQVNASTYPWPDGEATTHKLQYFTINSSSADPPLSSPTPLEPKDSPFPSIPTIEPTSTPTQQTGFLGTNLPIEYGYAIVAVLVILVVAGLSLIYLRKFRK